MAIEEQFRNILGREPSQAELNYFRKYMDTGDISEFEVGQYLEGLPERQEKRFQGQLGQFGQMLGQYDTAVLNKATDIARSRQVQMGRGESSAFGAQIAQAGQNLAQSRQPMLAQFYQQGMSNIGQNYLQRSYGAQERAYSLADQREAYNRSVQDYYRQKNDEQDALRGQSSRNLQSSLLGAGLGLVSGGVGGYLGGLAGGAGFARGIGGFGQPMINRYMSGLAGGNYGQMQGQFTPFRR